VLVWFLSVCHEKVKDDLYETFWNREELNMGISKKLQIVWLSDIDLWYAKIWKHRFWSALDLTYLWLWKMVFPWYIIKSSSRFFNQFWCQLFKVTLSPNSLPRSSTPMSFELCSQYGWRHFEKNDYPKKKYVLIWHFLIDNFPPCSTLDRWITSSKWSTKIWT